MKKPIKRPIRKDEEGTLWMVDRQRTTWYPNGAVNKLVFKNGLNGETCVRYDEAGNPICGKPSLYY